MEIAVGNIVKLKKKHPCGSQEWEVLRVGADFRLKCLGCGKLFHVECDYLDQVQAHIYAHHQFTIDNTKTVLYGLCAGCAAKRSEQP